MNLFLIRILRTFPLFFFFAPFCVPAFHNVLFSFKKKKKKKKEVRRECVLQKGGA